jgi:hypothetical protein
LQYVNNVTLLKSCVILIKFKNHKLYLNKTEYIQNCITGMDLIK